MREPEGACAGIVGKTIWGGAMSILYIIAALLVIAAVISLVLSLLGIVVTGALKLLPGVFIVLAIIFFARGGRIDVHVPDKWKKR